MGLRALLGDGVRLGGYDISEHQLLLFEELWPQLFREITTGVLDITEDPIPESDRPDVVFASTALMHIQRREAYQTALHHFLLSGEHYAVLMDNWNSHDYFSDLTSLISTGAFANRCKLYYYDSGGNIAVVVSLKGVELDSPYWPLTDGAILKKYS